MEKECEVCNKIFVSNFTKKKFCSVKCKREYFNEKDKMQFECCSCHKTTIKHKRRIKDILLCQNCSLKRALEKIDRSGPNSPVWKGGHIHWQAGKFGKDKDGLSWKKQRRLAWERDNYTCRDCGKKPAKRKPDVHHISPYRISRSHALDNLICLCQKCHKQKEATENALWDGNTFGGCAGYPERKPKPKCIDCGSKRKLNQDGRCLRCQRKNIDIPLAKNWYKQGKSMIEIGKILNVSRIMVIHWINGSYQYKA
jgi:hypothetical protein